MFVFNLTQFWVVYISLNVGAERDIAEVNRGGMGNRARAYGRRAAPTRQIPPSCSILPRLVIGIVSTSIQGAKVIRDPIYVLVHLNIDRVIPGSSMVHLYVVVV